MLNSRLAIWCISIGLDVTNGDKMKEVWKPIKLDKIQDRYAISNLGRVYDLKQNMDIKLLV